MSEGPSTPCVCNMFLPYVDMYPTPLRRIGIRLMLDGWMGSRPTRYSVGLSELGTEARAMSISRDQFSANCTAQLLRRH